jgi:hypothetical protein
MTWLDIFRKYDPNITEDEATYILWNETCFPFDNETTLKQIEEWFSQKKPT